MRRAAGMLRARLPTVLKEADVVQLVEQHGDLNHENTRSLWDKLEQLLRSVTRSRASISETMVPAVEHHARTWPASRVFCVDRADMASCLSCNVNRSVECSGQPLPQLSVRLVQIVCACDAGSWS